MENTRKTHKQKTTPQNQQNNYLQQHNSQPKQTKTTLFNKHFTNNIQQKTQANNRNIDKHTRNLPSTPIHIDITQTTKAIKRSKNNKWSRQHKHKTSNT